MESNTQPRDYDKDPIVIEDYNPLFQWLGFKYVVFPLLIIVIIISSVFFPERVFDWGKLFIILPIASFPIYNQYKNAKGKRKVVLYNNKICYKHDDKLITENYITHKDQIFRSFQNFYHKSQDRLSIGYFILIFLIGWLITKSIYLNTFIFLVVLIVSMVDFQLTKWIVSKDEYKLFHCILVFNEGDIISIPMINANDYLNVEKYFRFHGIEVDSLPVYQKYLYVIEKIEI